MFFIKLGTAVVYNERHATLNTLSTASDIVEHLSTLIPFVPVKPDVKVYNVSQTEFDSLWSVKEDVFDCSKDKLTYEDLLDDSSLIFSFSNTEDLDGVPVFDDETIKKVRLLAWGLLEPDTFKTRQILLSIKSLLS